jgi:hypothetical protein
VNGEGDYWIEVAKIGFQRRRFEIRKVGEEQVMLADARLASAVAQLDAVNITADNRALVNRNSRAQDVSGGDKALATSSAAISPDQAGNLAAMASTQPGIQHIPGMDGAADMFSAFRPRRRSEQHHIQWTRLGVGSLPPDARCASPSVSFPRIRRAADSRVRRSTSSRSPARTSRFVD